MTGGRGFELSLMKSPVSPARQLQLAGAGPGSLLTPLLQLCLGSGWRLRRVLHPSWGFMEFMAGRNFLIMS